MMFCRARVDEDIMMIGLYFIVLLASTLFWCASWPWSGAWHQGRELGLSYRPSHYG
jgi:hypothetical protein